MIEISKGKKVTSTRPLLIGGLIRNASITYKVFHINKTIQRKCESFNFFFRFVNKLIPPYKNKYILAGYPLVLG